MLELPWQCIPQGAVFTKAGTSRSGGRSLNGMQSAVGSGSGWWRARVDLHVVEEDQTLAWRAFYAAVDGMATKFLVPAYSRWRPRDMNGRMLGMHHIAGMGGSAHSEHFGYAQEEPDIARTIGNASLRDTRLTVRHQHAPALRPGHYFGIGERLYLIKNAWSLSHSYPVQTGGVMTLNEETMMLDDDVMQLGLAAASREGQDVQVIEFWPHLRAAAPHDTRLILSSPMCKMQVSMEETGILDQGAGAYGLVTLDLEEAI